VSEEEFLTRLGFNANPFQFTNADEEDHLQRYFLPPPYFDSVWGDPKRPTSQVIFAPRGGGKSAQRRMIEHRADKENVFTIAYDRFDGLSGAKLEQLSCEYHLRNIIRIALIGFLLEIHERGISASAFQGMEREQTEHLGRTYLGEINRAEAMESIKSLRTVSSRAKKFLHDWSGPVSALFSMILKAKGLGGIDLKPSAGFDANQGPDAVSKIHLEVVRELLMSIGFKSIYVLLDKVDETQLTGNSAEDSFLLIKPLIRDLGLLQSRGIGFKFFLWDKLEPHSREWGRSDRIQKFTLSWTEAQLNEMLSRRLRAFSAGEVENLADLTDVHLAEPLQTLVVLFASGSPRDMIRVCQEIMTEQQKHDSTTSTIGFEAIVDGILGFSRQRALELADADTIRDLKRVGQVDFTANLIANRVFRISVNSARNKIQRWVEMGIVERIGEERAGGGRPVYHYAISDVRVARAILPELEFADFIKKKVHNCNQCERLLIRDWDLRNVYSCPHCGISQSAVDLLEHRSGQENADR
jgi:predicted transcriptional regulator